MSLFFACDYVGQPTKEPGHKLEKLFLINIYAWLFFRLAWAAQPITPVYFKACSVSYWLPYVIV